MKSSHVKASVACYFRYKRQFPLISFERPIKHFFKPDILIITKSRKIIEIEVKVSLSDLKNDIKKSIWHRRERLPDLYPMPYQFYYAVPEKLKIKALEVINGWNKENKVSGKAGLLIVQDKKKIGWDDVYVAKKAIGNNKSKKVSIKDLITMVKNQTGTLCSCSVKIAKLEDAKLRGFFKDGGGI